MLGFANATRATRRLGRRVSMNEAEDRRLFSKIAWRLMPVLIVGYMLRTTSIATTSGSPR